MSSPLASAAGPIALVAGLAFAAVDVARLLAANRSLDRIEMMRQTPFAVANALYWVVFVGLVLALVSVYLRYAARTGGLGAVGFCFALVGTLDMAGNMWFDGFAAPWIADVAPGAILAGGSGMRSATSRSTSSGSSMHRISWSTRSTPRTSSASMMYDAGPSSPAWALLRRPASQD